MALREIDGVNEGEIRGALTSYWMGGEDPDRMNVILYTL